MESNREIDVHKLCVFNNLIIGQRWDSSSALFFPKTCSEVKHSESVWSGPVSILETSIQET